MMPKIRQNPDVRIVFSAPSQVPLFEIPVPPPPCILGSIRFITAHLVYQMYYEIPRTIARGHCYPDRVNEAHLNTLQQRGKFNFQVFNTAHAKLEVFTT